MSLRLEDLPAELLVKIVSYVKARDLARLAQVSTAFEALVTGVDLLWMQKIEEDFRLTREQCCNETEAEDARPFSARLFYTRLLAKFGKTVGFWQKRHNQGYLLRVECDGGSLIGTRITPPKHFSQDIKRSPLFTAGLDAEGKFNVKCYRGGREMERWEVEMKLSVSREKTGDDDEDARTLTLTTMQFNQRGAIAELCRASSAVFSRVDISPTPPKRAPLLPVECGLDGGLYKGSYRNEGVELVHVFSNDGDRLYGRKVTGDHYVPAGEITFRCDLSSPLHPTPTQMQRMASLRLSSVCQNLDCLCPRNFPPQPFSIPADCQVDVPGWAYPDRALAWFQATHVIAYPNFTHPQSILAHLIVFSRTEFGLMCFQLDDRTVFNSLCLFTKVSL